MSGRDSDLGLLGRVTRVLHVHEVATRRDTLSKDPIGLSLIRADAALGLVLMLEGASGLESAPVSSVDAQDSERLSSAENALPVEFAVTETDGLAECIATLNVSRERWKKRAKTAELLAGMFPQAPEDHADPIGLVPGQGDSGARAERVFLAGHALGGILGNPQKAWNQPYDTLADMAKNFADATLAALDAAKGEES